MISDKLSLLVLIRDYPVGLAVTKKIQNILYYLHKSGVRINVISYRSKFHQPAQDGVVDGIPFVSIGNDLKLICLHKTVTYLLKGMRSLSLNKRNDKINILYCIGPVNIENFLFVSWARVLGYKIIFDINEDYSFFEDKVKAISRLKIRTTQLLDSLTSKWGAAITVVSKHLKNKYLGQTDKPVVLIPVTARTNLNSETKIHGRALQVVYAGTFDLKDGVDTIIEGFRRFNRINKNSELLLIGKSDKQAKYQQEFKDWENVVFKGYVPDDQFYDMLKNADVLCMCRTNSGFSNAGFPFKLGEYLATGNPVISTRASDVCDYLTPDDAYLVDFDSPDSISDALKSISGNREEARRIGLNGFKKFERFFSPDSNGKLMLDLLNSLKP